MNVFGFMKTKFAVDGQVSDQQYAAVEKLATEFKIEQFRVCSFNTLLFKVKLLIDEDHKKYKIIRKMRIRLFSKK